MLRILMAVGALAIVALLGGRPAQAGGAPWCAVTDVGTGNMYWDCQYPSLEACVPHVVAGNRGFCNPNPRYRFPDQGRYRPRHDRDRG
jgi:hypothetical protein